MTKKPEEYSSVQKALEILKAFAPNGQPMGTLEISRKLDMHKSTVSRLIGVLTYHEFLTHDERTKKYLLGNALTRLCSATSRASTETLLAIAIPHMDRLRDLCDESVALEALINNEIMVIAESHSTSLVRVGFQINQKVAFNAAVGAKTILAYSPPKFVEQMMQGEFNRYTPKTITSFALFKKHLQEVREQGVAFDHGEVDQDVHAIAAPIFAPDNSPIAGVVVSMLERKMKKLMEEDLVGQVKKTAAAITQELRQLNQSL
ncbi:IclR family transcriptional regulator [Verrucomicrobia bacterium]|nr:IclR family transcriptional regulator [Verrucomicrobiota bacterium]